MYLLCICFAKFRGALGSLIKVLAGDIARNKLEILNEKLEAITKNRGYS